MIWRLKIFIKVLVAHLPISYRFWQRIGLFRHGQMDTASYVQKIFTVHTTRGYNGSIPRGLTMLELGPGDSLASGILAHSIHAQKIYFSDTGSYAKTDPGIYVRLAQDLQKNGVDTGHFQNINSFEDYLSKCNGIYLTNSINGLATIPDQSVDFSWSHSVLEHVRKRDFIPLFHEIKRITKPGGISSHIIDLQDHLDHSLNNLRFSDAIWEADWFAKAGFYTNRLQASEIIQIVRSIGFEIVFTECGRWPTLPIRKEYLTTSFREKLDEDLRTRTLSIVLKA